MKRFLKFVVGFLMLPFLLGFLWVLLNIPRAGEAVIALIFLLACVGCGQSFMEAGESDEHHFD